MKESLEAGKVKRLHQHQLDFGVFMQTECGAISGSDIK